VSWSDLDRALEPDHLTSVWIPQLAAPVGAELLRLAELVRTLRQRCPWDREQTHSSLTRHLLEESYEVLEAIEGLDRDGRRTPAAFAHLEEELGDLLFQVYFHATLAAEEGQFGLADVARGIHDKLVGRHPHVFGDVAVDSAEQVVTNWERIKKKEKGRRSVMDGVPGNLPALHHADKVQRRAGSVGFDWDGVEGPLAKIDEELAEVRTALAAHPARPGQVPDPEVKAEIGDLLFSVVNVARHAGVDPEAALRASSAEFVRRFRLVEERAGAEGVDMDAADLATLDRLWNEVKAAPGGAGAPPGGGPGA
jgi:tetrapyrrole methylase family protein / MazG family protein